MGTSFTELKGFVEDMLANKMKEILDANNEMKQELFVLRNSQALIMSNKKESVEVQNNSDELVNEEVIVVTEKPKTYASAASKENQSESENAKSNKNLSNIITPARP